MICTCIHFHSCAYVCIAVALKDECSVTLMCFGNSSQWKPTVHKLILMWVFSTLQDDLQANHCYSATPIYQHVAQRAVGSSSDFLVVWRINCWTRSAFLTFSLSSAPLPLSGFSSRSLSFLYLSICFFLLSFTAFFTLKDTVQILIPEICKYN